MSKITRGAFLKLLSIGIPVAVVGAIMIPKPSTPSILIGELTNWTGVPVVSSSVKKAATWKVRLPLSLLESRGWEVRDA